MMTYSSGKCNKGRIHEMCTIYGTWAATAAQFPCLHLIREGELFAYIPVFESSTAEQRKAGFAFSTVTLDHFHLFLMVLEYVTGKNNCRIERMRTSNTLPVVGDGNEVRPGPN